MYVCFLTCPICFLYITVNRMFSVNLICINKKFQFINIFTVQTTVYIRQHPVIRPDDAALVLFAATHVEKAAVRDGKDVWRQFAEPAVCVHVHMLVGVDGQQLVRVDCNQNGACVRLKTERDVSRHTEAQMCVCVCVNEHKQAIIV